MRRREFITFLGGSAVAWSRTARAQQPTQPVVGFLRNARPDEAAHLVAAFRKGLSETGYVEGRNVLVEYRWTGGQTDRLPSMAAELVNRQVNVIVALGSTPAVRAAKAATTTIPIVFMLGTDPVELGLVTSLNHPGGNLTGVINLNLQLAQKWLEILHELTPATTAIALLVNPANLATTEGYIREIEAAAGRMGLKIHILHANNARDFDMVFTSARERGAGALVIVADLLFISNIDRLAALSLLNSLPAIFPFREFVAAGGLASYGTNLAETYHLAGVYTGRIVKGEKPADLPVQQATRVELIINLKTARMLGLNVAPALLVRADEVIE
ncbi:ABC transporter substrate-binding protein [Bradyrhizobium sp.]|uniref:ABC transporter substrate-binding protein n=1 Tax=Bradyrhizobium sp. TaxID=376 RepID=UPI001D39E73E|nr:ABC transporter substrate-binding protein [Bradyrhizobium sp.]MBI5323171.1 ABC transporter substrate-binding protein [Bradyrhizobium sp.]